MQVKQVALLAAVLCWEVAQAVSLLAPGDSKSVRLAAETFADLWEKVSGETPAIIDALPEKGDVVVFGEEQSGADRVRLDCHSKLPQ